jgi:O-acetyl-ADP-ribose deacetylase (regulator of RNase III)
MLHFITGDMLQADAEALVNTVNTVGVMGKGIALQFKEEYPRNNKVYVAACKAGELQPGKLLPVWDESLYHGRKLIINFPTKTHWRQPSKYEYIEQGLAALRELIVKEGIKSIALPPLGCGNGGLDWNKVKPMIEEALRELPIEVMVYEPNATIKAELQKQETKKSAKLSSARAQLLYILFAYESLGEDSSLFAANKLAYFLQRMGQPLRLQFSREMYGPFAIGVQKVLYDMNGIYLQGLEQQQTKAFEPLQLNYERWAEVSRYVQEELGQKERQRLDNLVTLINGFHSELSLEILATTAYILETNRDYSIEQVMEAIGQWSSRKGELFKQEYVAIAYNHLQAYQDMLSS